MPRGPSPKESTIRMLCAKSAGICQFEGCPEKLFFDNVTTKEFNSSFVAHIVASSPEGTRGSKERSHLLSDKLENLMLMCAKHHRMIDDPATGASEYPESFLLEMKREHEESIDRYSSILAVPKTEIIHFSSPIKGRIVHINYVDTRQAVLPDMQPIREYCMSINISSIYPGTEGRHWNDLNAQLEYKYKIELQNILTQSEHTISLFPLAPMPLLIKLGALIGDKCNLSVFQKYRAPDTWKWQSLEITNEYTLEKYENEMGESIALNISLTDDINNDRIRAVTNPKVIYKIKATRLGVDSIRSAADLSAFWHIYQRVCDEVTNNHNKQQLDVFLAAPASAAFEVGRRRMPVVHPSLIVFDDNEGFMPTIRIHD